MSNNIYITYNIGGGSTDGWSLSGNSVAGASLGTTNDQGFDIITNNTSRITLSNEGEIGINTNPQSGVTVNVSGQIYADVYSGPQTIMNDITIPENTNSLFIGPDISFSGTVTVGTNSVVTII